MIALNRWSTELHHSPLAPGVPVPIVTVADVRSAILRMNLRIATGWDGDPGCVLGTLIDQLAGVFTGVFNLSLLHYEDHYHPGAKVACLDDYHPVSDICLHECFQRLVMAHNISHLPDRIDPLIHAGTLRLYFKLHVIPNV